MSEDNNIVEPEPTPEPTQTENPYQSIIEQQNEQIAALIAQNESLTGQITKLIQSGGAQLNSGTVEPINTEPEPAYDLKKYYDDDDLSLDALGKMVGKR